MGTPKESRNQSPEMNDDDSTLIPLVSLGEVGVDGKQDDTAKSPQRFASSSKAGMFFTSFFNINEKVKNGNGSNNDSPGRNYHLRKTIALKYPIHSAAENGRVKELAKLLEKGNPCQPDFKNRTALHYACGFPYEKKALAMVDIILDCDIDPVEKMNLINYGDAQQETGLHIAARTGHRHLVEKLIFAAADVNLKDKNGVEPLELIYKKVPAAMQPVFDCAIECKVGDPNDQNLILQIDFGSVIGYQDLGEKENKGMFESETKLLSYCLRQSEQKRSAILLHPLVQTFLVLKWKKIRILLWMSILYHVIWLLLYTLFITDLYLLQCPYTLSQAENDIESATFPLVQETGTTNEIANITSDGDEPHTPTTEAYESTTVMTSLLENGTECIVGRELHSSLNIKLGFLFFVTISVLLKEFFELYSSPQMKFYFYQLENVGQWILMGVVVLTSLPVLVTHDEFIVIKPWQYQFAALGIFVAWTLILSQVGKLPTFAVYIEILAKVLKSFTKFMITFASLLIAFMVSFQILMPEKEEFSNFPWAFIKIIVMMTGEINYDDIFFEDNLEKSIPFPTTTQFLYAVFVSIVTIILFNLLIGLTVSDIQGLQSVAHLSSLSGQLEQIYLLEKFLFAKTFQRRLLNFKVHRYLRYFLVTQQTDDPETKWGIELHISKVPKELQFQVRELAAPNMTLQQDEDDVDEKPDQGQSENKSIDNDDTSISASAVSEEMKDNFRIMVKDVLAEVLLEFGLARDRETANAPKPE